MINNPAIIENNNKNIDFFWLISLKLPFSVFLKIIDIDIIKLEIVIKIKMLDKDII
tara:strand:+ start:122 stop:289 length:168 start_codon:yes stop_codon:yes gene_type:complete